MFNLVIAYILLVSKNLLREFRRPSKKQNHVIVNRASSIFMIFYLLAVVTSPLLKFTDILNYNSHIVGLIGNIIMLFGLSIHIVAMSELRNYYFGHLELENSHKLVKSGVYSYIRHPGYFGDLILFFGFGLSTQNLLITILILLLFVPVYCYRIKSEEKMLFNRFKDEYTKYRLSTKRIIPFVF